MEADEPDPEFHEDTYREVMSKFLRQPGARSLAQVPYKPRESHEGGFGHHQERNMMFVQMETMQKEARRRAICATYPWWRFW